MRPHLPYIKERLDRILAYSDSGDKLAGVEKIPVQREFLSYKSAELIIGFRLQNHVSQNF
jgi:hypothetical protein